jgi:hypothetical protein
MLLSDIENRLASPDLENRIVGVKAYECLARKGILIALGHFEGRYIDPFFDESQRFHGVFPRIGGGKRSVIVAIERPSDGVWQPHILSSSKIHTRPWDDLAEIMRHTSRSVALAREAADRLEHLGVHAHSARDGRVVVDGSSLENMVAFLRTCTTLKASAEE